MSRREEYGTIETGFPFINAFNPFKYQEYEQEHGNISYLSSSTRISLFIFYSKLTLSQQRIWGYLREG